MVDVGVVGVVDVKEVVVEGVVVTGSKKILRFVRVLIPSKFSFGVREFFWKLIRLRRVANAHLVMFLPQLKQVLGQ